MEIFELTRKIQESLQKNELCRLQAREVAELASKLEDKTVTIAVLLASAFATIKNKDSVVLFDRTISKGAISKAVAVVSMSFIILFASTVLLSAVTEASALDIAYETVSATATVGLTRNLTPLLNVWGKLIIIVTMYLGRIGPISLAIAFSTRKESENNIKSPAEKISVG